MIKELEFRDRLEWRLDPGNAKIKPLPIFSLLTNKPSVPLAHNPLVGGSSPPGPTITIEYNNLRSIDAWTISPLILGFLGRVG